MRKQFAAATFTALFSAAVFILGCSSGGSVSQKADDDQAVSDDEQTEAAEEALEDDQSGEDETDLEEPAEFADEAETPSEEEAAFEDEADEPAEENAPEEDAEPEAEAEPEPETAEETPEQTQKSGCIKGDFKPFRGIIHAHSQYSDGEWLPEDAFKYGRDQGKLDMLIITDHLEQLYLPFPPDKLGNCLSQADKLYEPGKYLTSCGYEDGFAIPQGYITTIGHNNVFWCTTLFPPYEATCEAFNSTLVSNPECVAQWNHPGDDEQDRNDFAYNEAADKQINLMEFNGDTGLDKAWTYFFRALDAGWHVSPTYNQDNHGPDWGTKNDRRAGFFLKELTREELKTAMLERRSFMTLDKNASIKLTTSEGCWGGSVLTGYSEITLEIEAFDPDDEDGFERLEVYSKEGACIDSLNCGGEKICKMQHFGSIIQPTYFVVKAVQADGEYLVSSPIWAAP